MAGEETLVVERREAFGKGAARRLRAAGKIPAVLYGHGSDTQHIILPGHETMLIVRKKNAVVDLDIVGGKSELALVKDVQKDPVRRIIEHVDLVIVRRGEKVQVDVPVHVEGEPAPETIAALDATSVTLEVEATSIPENLVVSVEGLEDGTQILAGQISLPAGATLVTDPETLVVAVSIPAVAPLEEEVPEEETEEGEEGEAEEGAEGEEAEAGAEKGESAESSTEE